MGELSLFEGSGAFTLILTLETSATIVNPST